MHNVVTPYLCTRANRNTSERGCGLCSFSSFFVRMHGDRFVPKTSRISGSFEAIVPLQLLRTCLSCMGYRTLIRRPLLRFADADQRVARPEDRRRFRPTSMKAVRYIRPDLRFCAQFRCTCRFASAQTEASLPWLARTRATLSWSSAGNRDS